MVVWLLFWYKPALATAWQDPPPEDEPESTSRGSLKFRVLKPNFTWHETQESCATWPADRSDTDRVKAEIWWKLGKQEGRLFALLRVLPKKWQTQTPCWGDERVSLCHFPLHTGEGQTSMSNTSPTQWRLELLTPSPIHLCPTSASPLGQVCLRLSAVGPSPEDQHKLLTHTKSIAS